MFQVNVNLLAVAVGAVIYMALGFVWYSMRVFGKAWMTGVGKTLEQLGQPGPAYALTLVGALVLAYVLSLFVRLAGANTLADGALVGLVAGIGFVVPTFGAAYLFAGRSRGLYFIDAGYQIVALILIGALLAIWP